MPLSLPVKTTNCHGQYQRHFSLSVCYKSNRSYEHQAKTEPMDKVIVVDASVVVSNVHDDNRVLFITDLG